MENKETIITLKVDDTGAIKSIEGVKDQVKDTKDETAGLNKETKKTPGLLSRVGKGFKLVGGAIKAAGIGLLIGIVAKLTEALSKNQAVVDIFSTAMETVSIVIGEVVTIITDTVEQVEESSGAFTALQKVLGGLITLALTPLKTAFFGIERAILGTQLLWEESFLGDGDQETIDRLNDKLDKNKEKLIEVGEDAVKAGEDVVDNVGKAASGIVEVVQKSSEAIEDIDTEAAKSEADRIVQLRNRVKIEEAQLEGLTLKYQKQAEELRQIRDNEEASIEDRIKANTELGDLLIEQAEEERKLAQNKVNLLQQEIANGDTRVETQAELIRAQNALVDIEERITGQKSEQLTNEVALRKEREQSLNELEKIGKSAIELSIEEARVRRDENKKLIEKTVEDEKQKTDLLLANEQEFLDAKESITNENQDKIDKILSGDRELDPFEKLEKEREAALIELENLDATETEKLALKNSFLDKEDKLREKFAKEEEDRQKAVRDLEIDLATQAVGAIAGILGEGNEIGQGLAAASALMNTYQGITAALKDPTIPSTFARIAQASLVGIQGFAAVKNILSTDPSGSNVGSQSGASGGGAASTNISGGARFDLTEPTIPDEVDNTPTQVYVTTDEVSTQQSLDRNRQRNSRFI